MTSSEPPQHTADAAGGEAVFASDGLPSLAVPLPPPVGGAAAAVEATADTDGDGADEGGDAVVEDALDQRAAFDAFNDAGTGWMGAAKAGEEDGVGGGWVDPRRRLFQLKTELDELEQTLKAENERRGDEGEGEELRAAAAELQSRLAALGTGGSLATMLRGRQEDLSRVIARDVERFGEGGGLEKGMEGLSLTGKSKSGEGGDGKIVYELYRAGGSTAATVPPEAQLEERLRRLELAMGASSAEGATSIEERLAAAETMAREVDPKQIEKLAAKAKVVRADLEAAARARGKLASKSAGAGKEDAKAIADLHAQLVELEGMSAHLPALTVRLVELANLHGSAAEFASRLDAAESALTRSEGTLTSVEEALGAMEGGWKENLEAVEKNVGRLDELLAKAESS
ncbi:hypothetical protein ACHAXT_009666 [Thalassiosira profunda]